MLFFKMNIEFFCTSNSVFLRFRFWLKFDHSLFQLKFKSFEGLEKVGLKNSWAFEGLQPQHWFPRARKSQVCNLFLIFWCGYYFVTPINVLFCRPLLIHKNLIKCLILVRKKKLLQSSELLLIIAVEDHHLRRIALTWFLGKRGDSPLFC